jgi:hypothetical protein
MNALAQRPLTMSNEVGTKPVEGFEKYEITSDGRILSCGVDMRPSMKSGYPRVVLRKDGRGHSKYLHRLVAEAFVANPLCKPEVNHIDGDKRNNRASNLEWVTRQENERHSRWCLGNNIGENHGHAKLTSNNILEIRQSQKSQRVLGGIFGVSQSLIGAIKNRKIWRHI